MAVNSNGQFEYPSRGWSQAKMRKRGQRSDDEVQVAMDFQRRGQPETSLAETERAAGFGLAARGGSTTARAEASRGAEALSPDVIAQHKSVIQGFGNQWSIGNIPWRKLQRQVHNLGWEILTDPQKLMETFDPTGLSDAARAAGEAFGKRLQRRLELKAPDGSYHQVPLGEEQNNER